VTPYDQDALIEFMIFVGIDAILIVFFIVLVLIL
jgi:hypothetical protein